MSNGKNTELVQALEPRISYDLPVLWSGQSRPTYYMCPCYSLTTHRNPFCNKIIDEFSIKIIVHKDTYTHDDVSSKTNPTQQRKMHIHSCDKYAS